MRVPYAVRIEETLIKKLKITAVEDDKKINELLEEILEDYFNKKDKDKI